MNLPADVKTLLRASHSIDAIRAEVPVAPRFNALLKRHYVWPLERTVTGPPQRVGRPEGYRPEDRDELREEHIASCRWCSRWYDKLRAAGVPGYEIRERCKLALKKARAA